MDCACKHSHRTFYVFASFAEVGTSCASIESPGEHLRLGKMSRGHSTRGDILHYDNGILIVAPYVG